MLYRNGAASLKSASNEFAVALTAAAPAIGDCKADSSTNRLRIVAAASCLEHSNDGNVTAVAVRDAVHVEIVPSEGETVKLVLPAVNVSKMSLSPRGTYVVHLRFAEATHESLFCHSIHL